MLKKDNLSKNDLLSENLLFFYDHSFGSTYQYIDSLNSEVNSLEEIKKVDCSERASLVPSNIKSALILNLIYFICSIAIFYLAFSGARKKGTLINVGE